MIITHHGGQCFKVSFGDTTLVFDPPSKASKSLSPVRFSADIALISKNVPDFNGADTIRSKDKEPFVIDGPGAYEINGVAVRGYQTTSQYGGVPGLNTMYIVELEGMTLLFLGALDTETLPVEAREALDEVDIVFVPIGGDGVLDAQQARSLGLKLEARIIIPMHYDGIGNKDALKTFVSDGVAENNLEKLVVKKNTIQERKGDSIVLQS